MRIGTILVLFVVFTMMWMGQTVREVEGNDFNITNLTEQIQYQNISYELESGIDKADKIQVGLYKFMDAFAFATVEVGKESIKYGFNHPEYDFEFFLDVLVMFMYFIIAMMLITRLPYIVGILYVLWLGVAKLSMYWWNIWYPKREKGKRTL